MISYDLYLLLKEGNEQEFVKELKETYEEKLQELEHDKKKYQECRKHMKILSEQIFEEKPYCLNPEAPILEQIDTKLKTDPKSLRLYEQYRNWDSRESLYTERLWKLQDILRVMNNILSEYGINKDKSKLNNIYK